MNFSVKSVLKRRRNYLILFLFIFRTRCIYKSSQTPPSHQPKHTLRGEKAFPPHNGILISKREKGILPRIRMLYNKRFFSEK